MKKGKKIKELDDWLKNADSHVFDDKGEQKHKSFENVNLDYDFDSISLIDNTIGTFEFKKNGVQDYVLNKLRKMKVDDISVGIDLHGETVKSAIIQLNKFFSNAYANNYTYLKIICGKGINSHDQIPRIKITSQAFIKRCGIVNAACTAHAKDGGDGVLKVKIKN